jgi:Ca2+-binding EF-hand superfamily protein
MKLEKDCELQKINLALHSDFNLIDAFGILDQQAQGSVAAAEMLLGMNSLGLTQFTIDDCQLIFARYNKDGDGQLKYSEFSDAFMPVD